MKLFTTGSSVMIVLLFCVLIEAKKSTSHSSNPDESTETSDKKKEIFPLRKYEDFQISTGIAGKSLERAQKVFVEPFSKVSLSDVTLKDLDNIQKMSAEAVAKEKLFDQAIKKAKNNDQKSALNAGKTANKVLKLLGEVQLLELQQKLKIKQVDLEGRLKEHQTKLKKNVDLDRQNSGKKMASFLD